MKPAVLVLASVHFAGLESWIENSQVELDSLVDGLARFRPTRIALEVLPEHAPKVQDQYQAYSSAGASLGKGEHQQIGFRLARRCRLDSVFAFDADWELSWDGLRQLFPDEEALETAIRACSSVANEAYGPVARLIEARGNVLDVLRVVNSGEYQSANHSAYVRIAELGNAECSGGAEYTASWYLRNLRMYANLNRIAGERERVVAIVGADHATILLDLLRCTQRFEVVESLDYIPEDDQPQNSPLQPTDFVGG